MLTNKTLLLALLVTVWIGSLSPRIMPAQHAHDTEQDNIKVAKELKQLSDELQTALDAVVASDQLPGATLAISLSDGRQISLASGYEDVESQTPMPVNGPMLVGSTGKTYVSAVALQLVTEGKIKLDDLVSNHFADSDKAWFARIPNSEALTIRSLMNHTSGLPRYVFSKQFLADVRENPLKSRSPRECISVVLDMKPKHDVGNGWGYSDTNYLLLGIIIEKITGNSFYDEAQHRLLTPLGLKTTIPTTQARLPGLVQGYAGQPNPFGVPEKTIEDGKYALNPSFEWCGGGYMSNVGDLANWTQALHTGKVLGNEIYSELVSPVDFRTGKKSKQGYGLGAFVWQTELGKFVGHAGMMPGYLTQIEFSRTHHFSVAYQVNTDQGSSRTNHNHVVDFAKIVTKHLK
jgi:D-alanyl-D-alanine carboxypeptidase